MGSRSFGMFPIKAAWIDAETLLPSNGDALVVPNLQHSNEVTVVAYFDDAASGSVTVTDGAGNALFTLAAPGAAGKVFAVRSGYELGEVTSVKLDSAALTAGSAQVSLF